MFIKRKVNIVFITLAFTILNLIGCSKFGDRNISSLKEIEISQVTDNNLLNIIENIDSEEGVYLVQSESDQYIIFNGVKSEYKNITSLLNDGTLEVSTNTINSKSNIKQVFKVKHKKSKLFDTISVVKDGQKISFDNIFVK